MGIKEACCCPKQLLGGCTTTSSSSSSIPSMYAAATATATAFSLVDHFTNHESLPTLEQAFSNMKKAYPNYTDTDHADRIRHQDYSCLSNHACLDYIGQGLFSYSQQLHSNAPFFSIRYKSLNQQPAEFESVIKKRIFRFMNISSDEYSLVFTANQSSAFKALAESYPFDSNRNLLTVYDHHNEAVETMIESCRKRCGWVDSAVFSWPNMRIKSKRLRKLVLTKNKSKKGLFVFPLQSKVTGSRYSYLWMGLAQENGWHVCLDANALGPKDMETLGLSLFQPDFLICSFYKVFGENPSGFGCLFIKNSTSSLLLNANTTGGLLVSIVQASNRPLFLRKSNQQTLEETGSFLEVWKQDRYSGLEIEEKSIENNQGSSSSSSELSDIEFRGLDGADSLGLVVISSRIRYLVNWLVNAFGSLKHPEDGGVPLVRIYGPNVRVDRGPGVAFNVFDWNGEKIEPTLVQKLADRHNISLSCAILKHANFVDKSSEEISERSCLLAKNKDNFGLGIPVITAALGFLTNFEDVYRVWAFVSRFLDADFVEKERWRYMALNQTTVEV